MVRQFQSTLFAVLLVGTCLIVVFLGFKSIGSPELRGKILRDEQRVEALRTIARAIRFQSNGSQEISKWKKVPKTLADIKFSSWVDKQPLEDPLTKKPYKYRAVTDYSFEVCLDFELDSETVKKQGSERWRVHPDHGVGQKCFLVKINGPDPDWLGY